MTDSTYKQGIVTSPHYLASAAGLSILKAGGNAVEAAVGMAATLAVVYPHMTGLGGDSFWLIRAPDGRLTGIDASGAAAGAADLDYYARRGHKTIPFRGPDAALTVAGTVSGWQAALASSGGTLSLQKLLQPAIDHARTGVPITQSGAKIAASKDAELKDQFGYASVFRPEEKPLEAGDILRQPKLAETLQRLTEVGLDSFYTGALAEDIAADLRAAGSPLCEADLAAHTARVTKPLKLCLEGVDVYNLGPPTQGLSSLLILALLAKRQRPAPESYAYIHGVVEATKQAFNLSKQMGLGDPGDMHRAPQALLEDDELLTALAAKIDPKRAQPWPFPTEPGDTTWFGAMDAAGWSVSAIQSTYFEFGSGVVLPKTGLTWQNRGASFQLTNTGWNRLRPGHKPFHTLNPALASFADGRIMAYGTMGGEGQPQTQAAIFTRYADYDQDVQAAVSAPRWLLGRTWGETSTSLKLENRFDPALIEALSAAGHEVEIVDDYSEIMGHAGALLRQPDGQFEGAADPRSDGKVAAW